MRNYKLIKVELHADDGLIDHPVCRRLLSDGWKVDAMGALDETEDGFVVLVRFTQSALALADAEPAWSVTSG